MNRSNRFNCRVASQSDSTSVAESTMRNCLKHAFVETFKQYTMLSKCANVQSGSLHMDAFQESLTNLRGLLTSLEQQAYDHFDLLSGGDSCAETRIEDDDASMVSSCIAPRQKVSQWLRSVSPSERSSRDLPCASSQSPRSTSPVPSCLIPSDNMQEQLHDLSEDASTLAVAYPSQPSLEAGEMIPCEVSSSLSPLEFFVVPDSSHEKLKSIEHRLHILADTLSAVRIEVDELTTGLACCCYLNGQLLRAQVVEIGNEDAQVRFVDSGVSRFIPLDQVFPLPAFLARFPPAAHLCAIPHVDSRKLDAQTVDHFNALVASHSARFIVQAKGKKRNNERELVELLDESSFANLSQRYQTQRNGRDAVSTAKWPTS